MLLRLRTQRPAIKLTGCSGSPSICDNEYNNNDNYKNNDYRNSQGLHGNIQLTNTINNLHQSSAEQSGHFKPVNFFQSNKAKVESAGNNRSRMEISVEGDHLTDFSNNQAQHQSVAV